jgi:glyoxylase-like metal-dependent hydrolase (beta-lactamase superfamily II)
MSVLPMDALPHLRVVRPSLWLVMLGLLSRTAFGDSVSPVVKINAEAAVAPIVAQPLRRNVTLVTGSGGNITVLTGSDGRLLVDAGIAVSRPRLEKVLNDIGTTPFKYVVNTHWHWDHTDGNAWVHSVGATIIAHENVLKRLTAVTRVEDWDYTFPPVPEGGRPTVLVKATYTLDFDGETIVVKPYAVSHTDGDLSVYFRKADVFATGDTFWNGYYPFIDYSVGGGIDGMIRAANANIDSVGPNTIVVPGHGPIGDRAQLVEFRDMLVTIRKNVSRLKSQGKSLDEIVAAKPTAQFDDKWGGFVIGPAFFTRLVYKGV